ncbi:MAG: VWA domain-containing protein [Acidobacteria bacterium]|nr:VWA domain-containing protein [Acidobacteriota bacterium]
MRSRLLALSIAFALLFVGAPRHTRAQNSGPAPPAVRQRTMPKPAPTPGADADEEVERVETDLTNILLTAIDKNRRFVTTLKQEDVRVLEDGVPQQLFAFQRETDLPLSLALVIDISKSQEQTLPDQKTAARAFLERVMRPDRDSVAVVSFTGKPLVQQALTADRASLNVAIERLKVEVPPDDPECEHSQTVQDDTRCWSSIWDALWATTNQVLLHTPERTRRAAILLSDGFDTSSLTKKDELIDFAVKSNTVIYAIGISDRENYPTDDGALRKVSERTGGRAFFPKSREDLDAAFAQIEQELRSQYLVSYSPSNKKRDGSFRKVQIEIVNPALRKEKLRLLYRQGYYAKAGTK